MLKTSLLLSRRLASSLKDKYFVPDERKQKLCENFRYMLTYKNLTPIDYIYAASSDVLKYDGQSHLIINDLSVNDTEIILNCKIAEYYMDEYGRCKNIYYDKINLNMPLDKIKCIETTGCKNSGIDIIDTTNNKSHIKLMFDFDYSKRYCYALNINWTRTIKPEKVSPLSDIQAQTDELCMKVVKQNGLELQNVKKQTQEICIEAVRQNTNALQYVDEQFRTPEIDKIIYYSKKNIECVEEQTYESCMYAVKKNGELLRYVSEKFITPELCLEAVKQKGNAIEFVNKKYQTYEMCLIAARTYGFALSYIDTKYQTEELCLAAVKRYSLQLCRVQKQTYEICLAAVSNWFGDQAFCDVEYKYRTPEICMAAIKSANYYNLTNVIRKIPHITHEMWLEIMKVDGCALCHVKNQTPDICMAAVKENGLALKYVKNQTPELCLEAVKQNGDAFGYVKEQTQEIATTAVFRDWNNIGRINPKFKTAELLSYANNYKN